MTEIILHAVPFVVGSCIGAWAASVGRSLARIADECERIRRALEAPR
jgi:hypothetical protein